ncbi:MAG TPA: redoxin domain-containing protein [Gemmatimonadaceae bacterium]|nr:redoxin domain-containing protein [Gemmatimonadaceae bacterium]
MRVLLMVAAGFLAAAPASAHAQCVAVPDTAPALHVGDIAPDFSLPGSDGRQYRLSDYRGKQAVVLSWFAKAFTGG